MPKHATVVAYLALSVTLGGTAYAATGGNVVLGQSNRADQSTSLTNTGAGPALRLATADKTTAPLAVSNGTKIKRLNADEVDGLGAGAFARRSVPISMSMSSAHTVPAGHLGPWSMSLRCLLGQATFKIVGPGVAAESYTVDTPPNAGNTVVSGPIGINAGYNTSANGGQQLSLTAFLESGSKRAEIQLIMTATSGSPTTCQVIGAATPVS